MRNNKPDHASKLRPDNVFLTFHTLLSLKSSRSKFKKNCKIYFIEGNLWSICICYINLVSISSLLTLITFINLLNCGKRGFKM